ncbi:XPA binding protein 2 family protein [Toxoplasma gondii ME49]|uniref:XPA binding protein 2 family protein n=9 Tax=Toxoplasma gondii TaxID=5811 RepID=B6KR44_TOXGV|nr:XPA binding protein 2 family protein [Toxoplasma gondii ME49]EPT27376.1 XPA binding protein 2 family protein [Toxoplasma gondii ME49]ESS29045.1 XPA binding protein 2 family protein [Toxoplasma gondii VEG]KYF44796.1 XPA binding protein 2 family protein [Toxoplasma gondii ARI]CEL76196.1 TPA: XPA-binding protein, putative [Toxoplasma gondii VEG]|eukprot:XP_002370317.1 XPA binding protein 2 family protein [Toxoplasma gondii ME49]
MPPAVATAPDEGASSHHASSSEAVAGGEASVSLDEFNFVTKETDIVYEQELQRDPFQVKVWVGYLNSKKDAPPYTRFLLYERALRGLPGSYKLWFAYLKERVASLSSHDPLEDSRPFEEANVVFERALVHLSRMPKIWMLFVDFLKRQKLLTRTRRAFDRALQSLAVTQHDQVWDRYIQFVKEAGVVETTLRVYRRCLMLLPEKVEDFIAYLQSPEVGRYDDAARLLAEVVNDESSETQRTKHELWLELCDLVCKHPREIKSLRAEAVLRSGISRFSDQVGKLWCALASHFVRLGQLEKTRDVFEEALCGVGTLHDLALVYDAFVQFEESLLAAKMKELEDEENAGPDCAASEDAADRRERKRRRKEKKKQQSEEVDFLMTRLEFLTERRPLLVSSCKLRQNPHNVHEWLARVDLFKGDTAKEVETFSEAVATVDPQQAVGRVSVLWIAFARYYEDRGDLPNARLIFEKATKARVRTVDELASIWCEAVEMELRREEWKRALELVRRAISRPRDADPDSAQAKLFRSVKLWSLAADVEEMTGSPETVRLCYNKMFQLKVITPQLVINYAHFLEEHRFFEESFKVYERGIAAFCWPHLNDLWLMYLTKFVSRYGSSKLERARELFQQATASVPAQHAKRFFLLYAKLEEEFGLAKHALTIYQAATKAVPQEEKLDMYLIYIARTTELLGVARTRQIYEEAIENLPEKQARDMCLRYAAVEKGLGEVDRCRAIYEHCSQMCDPSRDPEFWKAWKDFEVSYGNEETFKDMLRVKRSVQAQYSQVHQNVSELADTDAPAAVLNPLAAAEKELKEEEEAKRKLEMREKALEEQLYLKKKKELDDAEIAQAEEEFKRVQDMRARARMLASLPPDAPFFLAVSGFQGVRPGYIFHRGAQGLGYYLDERQVGNDFVSAREKAFITDARPGARSRAEGGDRERHEEVDIDLEGDVPDEVFGNLAAEAKEMRRNKE